MNSYIFAKAYNGIIHNLNLLITAPTELTPCLEGSTRVSPGADCVMSCKSSTEYMQISTTHLGNSGLLTQPLSLCQDLIFSLDAVNYT